MKKIIYFLFFLSFMKLASASSDYVPIESGFISGSRWMSLTDNERTIYALGVVDGLKFSPVMAQGQEKTIKLANCTRPMEGQQIRLIAENYVKARPERWHEAVHYMIFAAVIEACSVFKK